MTFPEFPIIPVQRGLKLSGLRMTPELEAWLRQARTNPQALTNFLRICNLNPADVVAMRNVLVFDRATGETRKTLDGLGLKNDDLKIFTDGRIFLKQDFIPVRGGKQFKISTIITLWVINPKELMAKVVSPFSVETMVFYGAPGNEKLFTRDIRRPDNTILVSRGESRFEKENPQAALNRHREIIQVIQQRFATTSTKPLARRQPRTKKLPRKRP